MFGFTIGLILGFLCFFQIIFGIFLWFFLWREILYEAAIKSQSGSSWLFEGSKPNMTIYSVWGFLVPIILVLTIINFFYSTFEELKPLLSVLYNFDNSLIYLLIFVALSWIIRTLAVKNFIKRCNPH